MAIRPIVLYQENPDVLRRVSKAVACMDESTERLIRDLKDTLLHTSDGIGLAAPQIHVHNRVAVVRLGGDRPERRPGPPLCIINPEILEAGDARRDFDGCLSFPGLYGQTVRPHLLRVAGLNEEGEPFQWKLRGFDAVVVHHEMDHLDGILFIDRLEKPSALESRINRGELDRNAHTASLHRAQVEGRSGGE